MSPCRLGVLVNVRGKFIKSLLKVNYKFEIFCTLQLDLIFEIESKDILYLTTIPDFATDHKDRPDNRGMLQMPLDLFKCFQVYLMWSVKDDIVHNCQ